MGFWVKIIVHNVDADGETGKQIDRQIGKMGIDGVVMMRLFCARRTDQR